MASASPRRQALVDLLGLACRLAPADIDEEAHLLPEPTLAAINIAVAKARAVQASAQEVVVAADTLVVIDGDILGKPANSAEARSMLARLRARAHQVLTGVLLRRADLEWAGVVSTRVLMRGYAATEVDAYIARGEPFDKAGGYAIQDETFRPVERLEGCYLNVVGLPLCAVAAGLTALGEGVTAGGPPPCEYCARGRPLVLRSG
ncbi:MAG TPA: Maf family protein [Chloroflexota bacterium]